MEDRKTVPVEAYRRELSFEFEYFTDWVARVEAAIPDEMLDTATLVSEDDYVIVKYERPETDKEMNVRIAGEKEEAYRAQKRRQQAIGADASARKHTIGQFVADLTAQERRELRAWLATTTDAFLERG